MSETVLEEAQRIIYGDREQTYGHPSKNFEQTAAFWQVWLLAKHGTAPPLDVEDVAMMMVLLKLARQAHGHKRDNLVDLCGYAACIQKVLDYGAQARDHVLPVRPQAPATEALPPQDIQSVRGGARGPLVLGPGSGSVGGVEIPHPPEEKWDVNKAFARAKAGIVVERTPQ